MSDFLEQINEAYLEGVKGSKSDREKADLDKDGNIEPYEKKRANAIRKSQGKEHLCASKVKHEKHGVGKCISERHAHPDDNGHVSWYAIQFEHGIEVIDTVDLQVMEESSHKH